MNNFIYRKINNELLTEMKNAKDKNEYKKCKAAHVLLNKIHKESKNG